GDIDIKTAVICPDGIDEVLIDFCNDYSREITAFECFCNEEAGLYRSKAETCKYMFTHNLYQSVI
ncbi:MAG: hypothetical protein DRP56_07315, partial [Planctomycetota bacterium]